MSQQQRYNLDLLFKGVITVLLGVCSVFLLRTLDKLETTYESVIRLEVKVSTIEKNIEGIQAKR